MKIGIVRLNGCYIAGDQATIDAAVAQGGEIVKEACEWPTTDMIEIGPCEAVRITTIDCREWT